MNWEEEIELELARAAEAERNGNSGRTRASARRAVGLAVMELQRRAPEKSYGRDSVVQLRTIAHDPGIPVHIRKAADRLQAKLSPEFESPSRNPIEDARIIIQFIFDQMS